MTTDLFVPYVARPRAGTAGRNGCSLLVFWLTPELLAPQDQLIQAPHKDEAASMKFKRSRNAVVNDILSCFWCGQFQPWISLPLYTVCDPAIKNEVCHIFLQLFHVSRDLRRHQFFLGTISILLAGPPLRNKNPVQVLEPMESPFPKHKASKLRDQYETKMVIVGTMSLNPRIGTAGKLRDYKEIHTWKIQGCPL